jgi:membrane protein insertase Oxa1/YidC/SpoIIIJ
MFDGFWDNVLRYPRYLIAIILGIFLNTFEPLFPLLKRPVTLIALIGLLFGSLAFITFTLRAMLGLGTI